MREEWWMAIAAMSTPIALVSLVFNLIQARRKKAAEAKLREIRKRLIELPDGTTIPTHMLLKNVEFANDSELYESIKEQTEEAVRRLALDQVVAIVDQVLGGKIIRRTEVAELGNWWIEVEFDTQDGIRQKAIVSLPVPPSRRINAKRSGKSA